MPDDYNCMSTSLPPRPADMPYKKYVSIIRRICALQKQRREEVLKMAMDFLDKYEKIYPDQSYPPRDFI
ncbi:MAG: hypothetical protein ACYCWE_00720 [Eubacteriales bacterium]